MAVPRDIRARFRPPSTLAIIGAIFCGLFLYRAHATGDRLVTGAKLASLPNPPTLREIVSVAPDAWAYLAVGTAAAVCIAGGLLAQAHWARQALRLAALVQLCVVLPLAAAGVFSMGRAVTLHAVLRDAFLVIVAFTMQFRGEPFVHPLTALRLFPLQVWGRAIILADQVRRVLGASHYAWNSDSVAVARGGWISRRLLWSARGVPTYGDGFWVDSNAVTACAGRLLIIDPEYCSGDESEESGVVVDGVPEGEHRVEVQWVRWQGERDPRTVRMRVLWNGGSETWEEEIDAGAACVDSGRISVLDPILVGAGEADQRTSLRVRLRDERANVTEVCDSAGRPVGVACNSGPGDGMYQIRRAIRGGSEVGVVVDMTRAASAGQVMVPRLAGRRASGGLEQSYND